MPPRWVAVLLVAYVTLDFANPLMPGAVRLVGGEVQSVHADRARNEAPTLAALPAFPLERESWIDASRRDVAPVTARPDRPAWRPPVRRLPAATSEPAPRSEDH